MNPELRALLGRGGGVVTRAVATQVVPEWVVEHAGRRGDLVRMLPGVYRHATEAATPPLLRRAALLWLDGRGALSHTSALAAWELTEPGPHEQVHVTVGQQVRLRSHPGVVVHRRAGFRPEPPHALSRGGNPVTGLERSLVDAWPLLPAPDRRGPIIRAVNDRMTTPARIGTALAGAPRLPGRAKLRAVLDLLAAGCMSPLEIWGYSRVFTGPGMPGFQRQVRVRLGSRNVYLDVYAEAERVNFELDGAATHSDPRQRETDLRRDALLATVGILVVRFTHERLYYDTDAVRREVLAILASRRPHWVVRGDGRRPDATVPAVT